MILRDSTKKEIIDALDSSLIGKFGFDIKFPDESKKSFYAGNDFVATYIGDDEYYFKISQKYNPDLKKNGYNLSFAPGLYLKDSETVFVEEFADTLKQLKLWLNRLTTDIKDKSPLINKVYEEINRIEEEFEQKLNEKFDNTDKSYFNIDEVSQMKERIDVLFSQFEKLKEEHNIKDNELKTIKQELEKIKTTLPILPKTTWYKSSGKKIIALIGKYINPDTVKSIATEVVKGFLNNGR